jgi:hypothetical protein
MLLAAVSELRSWLTYGLVVLLLAAAAWVIVYLRGQEP